MRLLVTGGAGFIGSHFIRHVLRAHPGYEIVNLDKLTYAGNLSNLKDIEGNKRYSFWKGDICDSKATLSAIKDCDAVINFAAETHVDRSIRDAGSFIRTDVYGTYMLLEAARKNNVKRFLQISTDEVYGSVENGSFKETDPLQPSSPYSASKAGGDVLALSYAVTYGLPVLLTRSSNNFGPYQYPEKLIPLFITNLLEGKEVPLYGDGRNIRDWIYVQDNCEAIDFVFHHGSEGEIYNVGGGNEKTNLEITRMLLTALDKDASFIKRVKDRVGHDRRYSLNCEKINKLGWRPRFTFENALMQTVRWYKENMAWWRKLKAMSQ